VSTEHDVVFSWTSDETDVFYKFRLLRNVEGSYKERHVRAEISQQLLTQSNETALQSRPDSVAMYQTSWAGGARWWKPLIAPTDNDSYFQSNHMDTWSEPGKIVPTNAVTDAANTILHDNCVIAVGEDGNVYAIGFSESTDSGFFDVYIWTPGSDAFVRDTGQNSGVDDDDEPLAMVYDPSDGYFYIITTDPEIVRFTPSGNDEDASWIATGHFAYPGSNIFLTPYGLMFYDGLAVYSIDKAGPSATEEFDDGMGPDFLDEADYAGSNPLFRRNVRLAMSTPEGIYYVKNTRQGGQPQAFVFRVDRDAAGNFIGNPIATLPAGSVALSIAYHLGSVIITASPDWQVIRDNDTNEAEIVLYHITQGSLGALGAPLGGRSALDETPYALLGSQGNLLYLGGQKRLWVYDATRGGLHTAWSWGTELANGAYVAMANVLDSAGVGAFIYLGADRIARTKADRVANPDTVSSFGDDETHYTLESNYFDANLPLEAKRLDKLEILFDPSTGTAVAPNQEWTIQVSVDDAAFADVITAATSGVDYTSGYARGGRVNPRGRIFRYKVIYQTKTAVKNALRSILATFTTGEIIREWELLLDLSEVVNVENEVVSEDDVITDLRFMLEDTNEDVISYLDNYNSTKTADDTDLDNFVKVKVESLEIMKEKPGEGVARIVIREDPLGSATNA
jgi:hypothetical protein